MLNAAAKLAAALIEKPLKRPHRVQRFADTDSILDGSWRLVFLQETGKKKLSHEEQNAPNAMANGRPAGIIQRIIGQHPGAPGFWTSLTKRRGEKKTPTRSTDRRVNASDLKLIG